MAKEPWNGYRAAVESQESPNCELVVKLICTPVQFSLQHLAILVEKADSSLDLGLRFCPSSMKEIHEARLKEDEAGEGMRRGLEI